MQADSSSKTRVVKVWDPVVRSFHWLLVLAFAGAWGLGEWGPNQMTWHFYFGYTIGGLVVIRLIWGLIGPRSARFTSFLYGPNATLRYLRHLPTRDASHWPGHNPLGAWSVFAMLSLLILQVLTGLTSDPQDFINVGPWAQYVPDSISQGVSPSVHEAIASVLVIVVGLHIGAVLYYRFWKGENLVKPMITGKKIVKED